MTIKDKDKDKDDNTNPKAAANSDQSPPPPHPPSQTGRGRKPRPMRMRMKPTNPTSNPLTPTPTPPKSEAAPQTKTQAQPEPVTVEVEVVVMRNLRGGGALPPAPLKPDGSLYHYEMVYGDAKYRAYADDPAQLIGLLIGDETKYTQLLPLRSRSPLSVPAQEGDDDESIDEIDDGEGEVDEIEVKLLTQRLLYAVRCGVQLQARLLIEFGLAGCTPEEIAILEGPRDTPPYFEFWDAPTPLVLITLYYDPYDPAHPKPQGRIRETGEPDDNNLLWLNPDTDESLLQSLVDYRFIALGLVNGTSLT